MNYILVQIFREGSLTEPFGGRSGDDADACDQIFASKGSLAARGFLSDLRHVPSSHVNSWERKKRRLSCPGQS